MLREGSADELAGAAALADVAVGDVHAARIRFCNGESKSMSTGPVRFSV